MTDRNDDDPFDGVWLPATEAIALLRELGINEINRYFTCLMMSQGFINDELRSLLVRTAVSAVCLKSRGQRIKTDWCEGEVRTDFLTASFEGLSGVKFECKVDVENRTTKATFLVTSSLLERFPAAEWLFRDLEKADLKTSLFN